MKKNKIIIPAMAMILFSTAASISGTVAWFTANRVFNTDIAQFSVVETEGNLEVAMAPIANAGTEADPATTNAVRVVKQVGEDASPTTRAAVLTHGSVNAITAGGTYGHSFIVDSDDPEGDSFVDHGDATTAYNAATAQGWKFKEDVTITETKSPFTQKHVDVYVAVAWTMTFEYTFASDNSPIGIFLDLENSTMTPTADGSINPYFVTSDGTLDSAKGFRVGFYDAKIAEGNKTPEHEGNTPANAKDFVWGNNPLNTTVTATFEDNHGYTRGDKIVSDGVVYAAARDFNSSTSGWKKDDWNPTGEITQAKYVSATGTVSDYASGKYLTHDDDYNKVLNLVDTVAGTKNERIIVLTPEDNKVTVTCAAWFEGTDPNIVSGTNLKCLDVKLSVYARSLRA